MSLAIHTIVGIRSEAHPHYRVDSFGESGKPDMHLLETIFQWVNLGALCLVVTVFQRSIHRHKVAAPAFDSADDAFTFIQTVYLIVWWAAGTALFWIDEVNPFWILAWLFIGFAFGAYIEHLCTITGIRSFLNAGVQRYQEFMQEELAKLGCQSK